MRVNHDQQRVVGCFATIVLVLLAPAAVQAGFIYRANLDGTGITLLFEEPGRHASGLAVDLAEGRMYWTHSVEGEVRRANLDGSDLQVLVTNQFRAWDIELIPAADKMYWTNEFSAGHFVGKIVRANLDGTGVEDVVIAPGNIRRLALDPANGKTYWTDGWTRVRRANHDGSALEELVNLPSSAFQGIVMDVALGKMFWADEFGGEIRRADLDGSNIELLLTQPDHTIDDLVLDAVDGKMYWSTLTGKIQRADLDASDIEDVLTDASGSGSSFALDLDTANGHLYFTSDLMLIRTGACCTPFECTEVPRAECIGEYRGDDTTCNEADCAGPLFITLCHTPPGNPGNAHTITVGLAAAQAHLNHGDTLGPCWVDLNPRTDTWNDEATGRGIPSELQQSFTGELGTWGRTRQGTIERKPIYARPPGRE